jgi:hypothetical protein
LSKILESLPPERSPWDRGPDSKVGLSSNLMRCWLSIDRTSEPRLQLLQPAHSPEMPLSTFASIFARTFRKYRTFLAKSSESRINSQDSSLQGAIAQRKYQRATSTNARATKARERNYLSGHAMACSLRISLQGSGGAITAASTDPTNQLPTSLRSCLLYRIGAGPTATGMLHCFFTATF